MVVCEAINGWSVVKLAFCFAFRPGNSIPGFIVFDGRHHFEFFQCGPRAGLFQLGIRNRGPGNEIRREGEAKSNKVGERSAHFSSGHLRHGSLWYSKTIVRLRQVEFDHASAPLDSLFFVKQLATC